MNENNVPSFSPRANFAVWITTKRTRFLLSFIASAINVRARVQTRGNAKRSRVFRSLSPPPPLIVATRRRSRMCTGPLIAPAGERCMAKVLIGAYMVAYVSRFVELVKPRPTILFHPSTPTTVTLLPFQSPLSCGCRIFFPHLNSQRISTHIVVLNSVFIM